MGISQKVQVDGGLESEGKKWVSIGIPVKAPLKKIKTKRVGKKMDNDHQEEEECPRTPTNKEARIPEKLPCPPAPRKRRPSSRCNFNAVRKFFTHPDLDSVFICQIDRAS